MKQFYMRIIANAKAGVELNRDDKCCYRDFEQRFDAGMQTIRAEWQE
jgi:hypothetical protein